MADAINELFEFEWPLLGTIYLRPSDIQEIVPPNIQLNFDGHKSVGSFKIGPDGEYLPDGRAKLLKLPQQMEGLDVDLSQYRERVKLEGRDPETGDFQPHCYWGKKRNDKSTVDFGESDHDARLLDLYLQYFYRKLIDMKYFKNVRELPKFVVAGRSLSTLLRTSFDKRENWSFLITRVSGIFFMMFVDSPESLKYFQRSDETSRQMQEDGAIYGLAFRDFVTRDPEQELEEGGDSELISDNEKFHRMVEANLGAYKMLILTKQIDAVQIGDEDEENEPIEQKDCLNDQIKGCDVEVTMTFIKTEAQPSAISPGKLLRLWSDCEVSGFKKVVHGFRTRDGLLKRIVVQNVSDIPGIVPMRRPSSHVNGANRPQRGRGRGFDHNSGVRFGHGRGRGGGRGSNGFQRTNQNSIPASSGPISGSSTSSPCKSWDDKTCLKFLYALLTKIDEEIIKDDAKQMYLLKMRLREEEAELQRLPHGQFLFLPSELVETLPTWNARRSS